MFPDSVIILKRNLQDTKVVVALNGQGPMRNADYYTARAIVELASSAKNETIKSRDVPYLSRISIVTTATSTQILGGLKYIIEHVVTALKARGEFPEGIATVQVAVENRIKKFMIEELGPDVIPQGNLPEKFSYRVEAFLNQHGGDHDAGIFRARAGPRVGALATRAQRYVTMMDQLAGLGTIRRTLSELVQQKYVDTPLDEIYVLLTVAVQNYQIGTLFRVDDIYCSELNLCPTPPNSDYENLFGLYGPYFAVGDPEQNAGPCAMEIDSFLVPLPTIIRAENRLPPIIR